MSRKIWQLKLDVIMAREKELEFPEFIRQLRTILGFSRKVVSDDTGISKAKLLDLEGGHFSLMPKHGMIELLADYYEVSKELLNEKCEKFCLNAQKDRKQFQPFFIKHPEWTPKEVIESQGSKVYQFNRV